MTEAEWLAWDDPERILLPFRLGAGISPRKARLLLCAVARAEWPDLADEASRRALEVVERVADDGGMGLDRAATLAVEGRDRLCRAFLAARRAAGGRARRHVKDAKERADASALISWATHEDPFSYMDFDLFPDRSSDPLEYYSPLDVVEERLRRHSELVREVFGNPFRPQAPLATSVFEWDGGIVPRLAAYGYEIRLMPSGHLDPAHLAVLSDALEEAGCTSPDLLTHLRSPGPHVRGCWALDLLLGKS